MKIWLDDVREPPDNAEWVIHRRPESFCMSIMDIIVSSEGDGEDNINETSFDHDLGIGPDGYDCAVWLIQTYKLLGKPLPKLSIHSQNPVGRERLERLFEEVNQ